MPTITMPRSERALIVQALADDRFLYSLESNPGVALGRLVAPPEQARIREICALVRRLEPQIRAVIGVQSYAIESKCAGMPQFGELKCGA